MRVNMYDYCTTYMTLYGSTAMIYDKITYSNRRIVIMHAAVIELLESNNNHSHNVNTIIIIIKVYKKR